MPNLVMGSIRFGAVFALIFTGSVTHASSVQGDWFGFVDFAGAGLGVQECVGNSNCDGRGGGQFDPNRSQAMIGGTFDGMSYSSSASVGTGDLKLSVQRGAGFAAGTRTGGSAQARVGETINLSSPKLLDGQNDILSWSFTLDGTFETGGFVDTIAQASTTGDLSRARVQWSGGAPVNGEYPETPGVLRDVATASPSARQTTDDILVSVSNGSLVFSGDLEVTSADPNVSLAFSIFAVGLFDFANTGSFEVALEDGQSFFSSSGVFLSGTDLGDDVTDPSVVPVPASLPLLLGALGLAFARRQNRHKI